MFVPTLPFSPPSMYILRRCLALPFILGCPSMYPRAGSDLILYLYHLFVSCMHAKSFQLGLTLRPYGLEPTRVLCPWGFSRQEYWGGVPCHPPRNLSNSGIEPAYLMSPALASRFFTTSTTWEALIILVVVAKFVHANLLFYASSVR